MYILPFTKSNIIFVLHLCCTCVARVSLVWHSCCTCVIRIVLVLRLCCSCCTCVACAAIVLLVSQSCRSFLTLVLKNRLNQFFHKKRLKRQDKQQVEFAFSSTQGMEKSKGFFGGNLFIVKILIKLISVQLHKPGFSLVCN